MHLWAIKHNKLTEQEIGVFLEHLFEQGYDENYGARPLKRAIQRYLEDELADIVLSGELAEGDTILMELVADTSEIKAKIVKAE